MNARMELRRNFYDLLIKDKISLETNIVNTLLFEMAGIKIESTEDFSNLGLNLSDNRWDKDKSIKYQVPNLHLSDLYKLLDFLQVSKEDYVTNKSLTLNSDFVFRILLPKFKDYYETVKAERPSEIRKYQVQSKAILDETAMTTLRQYTQKALETLMKNYDFSDLHEPIKTTITCTILRLDAAVSRLQSYPQLYRRIIGEELNIYDCLKTNIAKQNSELTRDLRMLLEGLQLFAQYTRSDAILANLQFKKEMEQQLNSIKISSSQCAIVEDMLLDYFGIQLGKKGKAKLEIGYDNARMVFKLEDLDQLACDHIVNSLLSSGDETAVEGDGDRKHASAIPENLKCMSMSMDLPYRGEEANLVEKHSIEMDGTFLYHKIFPVLKLRLEELQKDHPERIKNYQQFSQEYFKRMEKTNADKSVVKLFKDSVSGLFSVRNKNDMEVEPTAYKSLRLS